LEGAEQREVDVVDRHLLHGCLLEAIVGTMLAAPPSDESD
jgi:hypothetical protein